MKHLVIFLILSVCLIGCTNNAHTAEWSKIDTCIQNSDTTALTLLRRIGNDKADFTKADRMRYELLLASAHNKFFISMKSDSTLNDVVDYYLENGSANERMEATYLLGCVYRDMGDTPLAIKYYQDAIKHADILNKDCDFYTLSRICGQMGGLFEEQDSYNIMLSYFKLASKYAFMAKDTLGALSYYKDRGMAYYLMGKYDSVFITSKNISNLYRRYGYKDLAFQPSDIEIYIYLLKKQFVKAKRCMDISKKYFAKTNIHTNEYGINEYYKGLYYLGINKIDSAKYYFERELYGYNDYNNKQAAAKGLFNLYKKEKDADSIVKYSELWNNAVDSSYAHMSTRHLQQMHAIFNYSTYKDLAQQKEYQLKIRTALIIVIIVVLFLLFLIFYMRNRLRFNKIKEQNTSYAFDILTLRNREQELSRTLKKKDSQNSEFVDQLHNEIESLQEKLSLQQSDKLRPDQWGMRDAFFNASIVNYLHALSQKGQQASYSDIKNLCLHFEKYDNAFLSFLIAKESVLKEREFNLCLFTRLRFLPSEMACLLDVSPQVITNLRAKLLLSLYNIKGGAQRFDEKIRKS
jgi:hypothetical protein